MTEASKAIEAIREFQSAYESSGHCSCGNCSYCEAMALDFEKTLSAIETRLSFLSKLVEDAWWEGHRCGEDDTMAYERGYKSKAPIWDGSDSFKKLHGLPLPGYENDQG